MVLWAFSRPGDLNFDAFITASSCSVFLGSNRKAVVGLLGSSTRLGSSCGVSAAAGVVAALA